MRLSIDLEHMGHLNESLSVAEAGVIDPWVRAGSKMALQRQVLRLSKPPRCWKTLSYAKSVKRKIKEVSVLLHICDLRPYGQHFPYYKSKRNIKEISICALTFYYRFTF